MVGDPRRVGFSFDHASNPGMVTTDYLYWCRLHPFAPIFWTTIGVLALLLTVLVSTAFATGMLACIVAHRVLSSRLRAHFGQGDAKIRGWWFR